MDTDRYTIYTQLKGDLNSEVDSRVKQQTIDLETRLQKLQKEIETEKYLRRSTIRLVMTVVAILGIGSIGAVWMGVQSVSTAVAVEKAKADSQEIENILKGVNGSIAGITENVAELIVEQHKDSLVDKLALHQTFPAEVATNSKLGDFVAQKLLTDSFKDELATSVIQIESFSPKIVDGLKEIPQFTTSLAEQLAEDNSSIGLKVTGLLAKNDKFRDDVAKAALKQASFQEHIATYLDSKKSYLVEDLVNKLSDNPKLRAKLVKEFFEDDDRVDSMADEMETALLDSNKFTGGFASLIADKLKKDENLIRKIAPIVGENLKDEINRGGGA